MAGTDTSDRIVAAARALLVAEGADAVSMRKVAAEAGITPMATYRHFANREALLQAVADECSRDLSRGWAGRAEVAEPRARISALLDGLLDFALGSPHLYRLLAMDRRKGAPGFLGEFHPGDSTAYARLMEAVEHGIRKGVLRPGDLAEVALTLTAQAQGLVELYFNGRIDMSEEDFRALCHRSVGRLLDGLAN